MSLLLHMYRHHDILSRDDDEDDDDDSTKGIKTPILLGAKINHHTLERWSLLLLIQIHPGGEGIHKLSKVNSSVGIPVLENIKRINLQLK